MAVAEADTSADQACAVAVVPCRLAAFVQVEPIPAGGRRRFAGVDRGSPEVTVRCLGLLDAAVDGR